MQKGKTMQKEDVWLHSTCSMCNAGCGILVHRVDGVAVDIKGDPDHPTSRGKLCAKGPCAIMSLYDPDRLKTPLKRTNPEKGLGVDPRWVPISWDEALDIAEKELARIRKEDPRKLTVSSFSGGAEHACEQPGIRTDDRIRHPSRTFCQCSGDSSCRRRLGQLWIHTR